MDVLKVLAFHEAKFRAEVGTPLNELAEARAAVAELIEAGVAIQALYANGGTTPEWTVAKNRFNAALARVQQP